MTDESLAWFDDIVWGPCPGWCTRNPDPTVGLEDGGHFFDLREDGSAIRMHDCRWPLPDSDQLEAVQAVELEAIEACVKGGNPVLGEARFLVNTDEGQYMSVAAAVAASEVIRRAIADMALRSRFA